MDLAVTETTLWQVALAQKRLIVAGSIGTEKIDFESDC